MPFCLTTLAGTPTTVELGGTTGGNTNNGTTNGTVDNNTNAGNTQNGNTDSIIQNGGNTTGNPSTGVPFGFAAVAALALGGAGMAVSFRRDD